MIVHEMASLAPILYYRIGGTARYLLEATGRADILEALPFVQAHGLPRLMIVGLGSNLLFPDGLFDGAILRIAGANEPQIRELGEGVVEAYAGDTLDEVIKFGFTRGYVGLEWAGGLPGTVGAAVRGNVGAFGGELKDVLRSAEVVEVSEGGPVVRTLSNPELGFAYRNSAVKRHGRMVVLSATFGLGRAEEEELGVARATYESNVAYREKNHPMEYPTCGSVFKNLEQKEDVEKILTVWPDIQELVHGRWHGKVSMGYAIGRLGLKGYQIGGAQISPKHCNFIVNLGSARFADVHGLIEKVQQEFSSTFGFTPEPEVEIVR